jgi:hypothetical protein
MPGRFRFWFLGLNLAYQAPSKACPLFGGRANKVTCRFGWRLPQFGFGYLLLNRTILGDASSSPFGRSHQVEWLVHQFLSSRILVLQGGAAPSATSGMSLDDPTSRHRRDYRLRISGSRRGLSLALSGLPGKPLGSTHAVGLMERNSSDRRTLIAFLNGVRRLI